MTFRERATHLHEANTAFMWELLLDMAEALDNLSPAAPTESTNESEPTPKPLD